MTATLKSPMPAAGIVSVLVHAALALLALLPEPEPRVVREVMEMELVAPPAPPPEPLPVPEEPAAPAEPAPPPPPARRAAKPPPAPPAPTPEPPPAAAPAAPVRIGVSLSGTAATGSFAVPVGTTAIGKVAPSAPPAGDPLTAGPALVPASRLERLPRLVSQPEPRYTLEAREAGVEGDVVLLLTIDERGRVTQARVVRGLGHGLDQAAREAALAFRFEPGTRGGQPAATRIQFQYSFVLN